MITQSKLKKLLIYNQDTGIFIWKERSLAMFRSERSHKAWNVRFAGKPAGTNRGGYTSIWINGGGRAAHRLAWLYVEGFIPKMIDHKNQIKTDNRFSNLREANSSKNKSNSPLKSTNSSGFKGVSWHKRESAWRAAIGINRKVIQIGHFDCPIEAAKAYDAAALRIHSEFAHTNKMMGLLEDEAAAEQAINQLVAMG